MIQLTSWETGRPLPLFRKDEIVSIQQVALCRNSFCVVVTRSLGTLKVKESIEYISLSL
jgi:hypothetical protein